MKLCKYFSMAFNLAENLRINRRFNKDYLAKYVFRTHPDLSIRKSEAVPLI